MSEYWFARCFPVSDPRTSMAPVHLNGWAMFGWFIACMIIGAIGFALSAQASEIAWGVLVFCALTAFGAGALAIAVAHHGDQIKTAAEYRSDHAQR